MYTNSISVSYQSVQSKNKKRLSPNNKEAKFFIWFEFFFAFLFTGIRDFFGLPNNISYLLDAFNILVFCLYIFSLNRKILISSKKFQNIIYSFYLIVFVAVISALVNMVSPLMFIWSFRNFFRGFIFFYALIAFFRLQDLHRAFKWLTILQVVNLIISLIQYIVFGYEQDRLGGIFGVTVGVNAYTNIFLCISLTWAVQCYFRGRLSLGGIIYYVISWFAIAALAELKVAYLEIPIIIVLGIILNKKSMKSFSLLLFMLIALMAGISMIEILLPGWTSAFSSIDSFIGIGFSIGGGYNISRLNAYNEINQLFFHGDVLKNLLGYGFGNCEYSSFNLFTSNFYRLYGNYHYRWFSNQMIFLQTGYLGVISYFIFFVCCLIWFIRRIQLSGKHKDASGLYGFGIIYCLMLVINFFYNCTFNVEVCYLAFFGLALPFIYWFNKQKRLNA